MELSCLTEALLTPLNASKSPNHNALGLSPHLPDMDNRAPTCKKH